MGERTVWMCEKINHTRRFRACFAFGLSEKIVFAAPMPIIQPAPRFLKRPAHTTWMSADRAVANRKGPAYPVFDP